MNSVLNPEAPEFYPHLTSVTQETACAVTYCRYTLRNDLPDYDNDGYSTVHRTIRSSNKMPHGASFDNYKTYTDFNIVTCQLRENVDVQANQIIVTEMPAVKLKLHDREYNLDKVGEANDCMLDRVNIGLDTLAGMRPWAGDGEAAAAVAPAPPASHGPIIAKIQVGSTMFIGAKNIPRPQLLFKEPVDNSNSLWVPRISDKPNAITPLALSILYNDEGEAVGYEHPYKVELELYHPSAELLTADDAPPAFPPPLELTPLTLVQTPDQVDALVAHLAAQPELAVDLEHHSYRTYQGITCLIQISTDAGGDFVVDALAVREHLHKLNQIFTDRNKIKVFHGAESDVLWLQRDFGVYVVGMFDTHRAAKLLGLPRLGLKDLLMHYCGITADKKFQLADWRIRPLPAELLTYARCDTHYLLYVWRRLRQDLLAAAATRPHLLLSVFEASRQICATTYNKETVRPDSHLSLYVRSHKAFRARQMAALKMLYKWRDVNARELDESTQYLLPNHMLLALAEHLPREVQGVNAICCPMPPFVKQHVITIHRMLLSCREIPMEPALMRAPSAATAVAPRPPPAHALHDLANFNAANVSQPLEPEQAERLLARGGAAADIPVFEAAAPSPARDVPLPAAVKSSGGVVSDLNVDAKLFIPPYDRYKNYRTLAQIEELKEFKEKEARIAAISKGNELIKAEVLLQLQRAQETAAKAATPTPVATPTTTAAPTPPPMHDDDGKMQRKRKMSEKERQAMPRAQARARAARSARAPAAPKTPLYKNVNYRKFYDDAEKARKQPKMKFKKHK